MLRLPDDFFGINLQEEYNGYYIYHIKRGHP
jgi:hypothetical protein